jgi:hypothetical protein
MLRPKEMATLRTAMFPGFPSVWYPAEPLGSVLESLDRVVG